MAAGPRPSATSTPGTAHPAAPPHPSARQRREPRRAAAQLSARRRHTQLRRHRQRVGQRPLRAEPRQRCMAPSHLEQHTRHSRPGIVTDRCSPPEPHSHRHSLSTRSALPQLTPATLPNPHRGRPGNRVATPHHLSETQGEDCVIRTHMPSPPTSHVARMDSQDGSRQPRTRDFALFRHHQHHTLLRRIPGPCATQTQLLQRYPRHCIDPNVQHREYLRVSRCARSACI